MNGINDYFSDPRPTTIGKRKTSVLRQPQAPSATYEEETYGEGGGGRSSYVSRGSSPYFDTRLLDKNDGKIYCYLPNMI